MYTTLTQNKVSCLFGLIVKDFYRFSSILKHKLCSGVEHKVWDLVKDCAVLSPILYSFCVHDNHNVITRSVLLDN